MRMLSIASGSSGNAIYVGSERTHLLVDAGISGKRIEEGLHLAALTGADLDGILITHEHSDHIKSIGVMARKHHIPMYATRKTIDTMAAGNYLGKVDWDLFQEVRADHSFVIGDIEVNPMKISHDAADPVAYRFYQGTKKCAVCTDLGTYTDYTVKALQGLDVLLLESNHDVRMLQMGPYTYPLKQRILSDHGHLSNESSGRLLSELLHDDIKKIFLGHLSGENNLPDLAYEAVRMEITMGPAPYRGDDFDISVASRHIPGDVVEW
ncbi:MAG: MBL fold metallo-hydrolase [Lachnospiraceae bacterium]|nr:MBL fold metallo-hydrolase [Lachnospiraceae bacterium]